MKYKYLLIGIATFVGLLAAVFFLVTQAPDTSEEMRGSLLSKSEGVLFLSDPNGLSELWFLDSAGANAQQVSPEDMIVSSYDFDLNRNIVISARNHLGWADLWLFNTSSESWRLLLDCGSSICQNPRFSPNGTWVIFSSLRAIENQVNEREPGIWQFDLTTGTLSLLLGSEFSDAQMPCVAPDGLTISFYLPSSGHVGLINLEDGNIEVFESMQGGSGDYSQDGEWLYFSRLDYSDQIQFTSIVRVNTRNGNIEIVLDDSLGRIEYGQPAISPDGTLMALNLRPMEVSELKQIWIISINGSTTESVTRDPTSFFSAPDWNEDGDVLVFQRYQSGSSENQPDIMIWHGQTGDYTLLHQNAGLPHWIP